jgi:hypothetical protein
VFQQEKLKAMGKAMDHLHKTLVLKIASLENIKILTWVIGPTMFKTCFAIVRNKNPVLLRRFRLEDSD